VREAAPNATVIVTGYPLLFENPPVGSVEFLVNQGILALNATIEATVLAAGSGFVYVDLVDAFAGHSLGSADPWLVAPPAPDAFHPNPAGYAAIADAILAVL